MWVISVICTLIKEAEGSINRSQEECPRGLFLLERGSSSLFSPIMSSLSSLSTRDCVQVCPLGFYHSITLKNKPTFADLNSGSGNRHASLKCLPCKQECTACLGPRPDSCFVCSDQWIQKHKSSFGHETLAQRKADLNSTSHDCHIVGKISLREQKREFSGIRKKRSVGTVALLVALSAMFSAVLVFSVYRLHWERRHRGNEGTNARCSVKQWFWRCWERKNYSAISADQLSAERTTWSAADQETVTFSTENL